MNESLKKDYDALMDFWNKAFVMTEEERQEEIKTIDPENDWKAMAPSEKLLKAASSLGVKNRVLDYGCGSGWAGIAAAKSGCRNVLCVDVAPSGAEMARFYSRLFRTQENVECHAVTTDWISGEPDEYYDGFICSNVLDVIPAEEAENIVCNASRIVTDDAEVIIGLNYYMVPKDNPERNTTVKYGNHVYIDGILRMVSLTDSQWTDIFEKYFKVVDLDHFSWPGEKSETRRLFRLKKK